jgi:hypothetical protein
MKQQEHYVNTSIADLHALIISRISVIVLSEAGRQEDSFTTKYGAYVSVPRLSSVTLKMQTYVSVQCLLSNEKCNHH